jgi:hypothetical protein
MKESGNLFTPGGAPFTQGSHHGDYLWKAHISFSAQFALLKSRYPSMFPTKQHRI